MGVLRPILISVEIVYTVNSIGCLGLLRSDPKPLIISQPKQFFSMAVKTPKLGKKFHIIGKTVRMPTESAGSRAETRFPPTSLMAFMCFGATYPLTADQCKIFYLMMIHVSLLFIELFSQIDLCMNFASLFKKRNSPLAGHAKPLQEKIFLRSQHIPNT